MLSGSLANLINAIYEGGKRNGVLTLVEDFLNETDTPYLYLKSRVEYGLGIIIRLDDSHDSAIESNGDSGFSVSTACVTI